MDPDGTRIELGGTAEGEMNRRHEVGFAARNLREKSGHLLSRTRLLLKKRLRQFRADALGVGVEVEDVVAISRPHPDCL
jgi:hypothetical protein